MTVSAVLNGKGDTLRISQATQNRIQRVAKAMGYLPNISARKFRTSQQGNIPQITIFWAIDTHASLIGRTIVGMERAIVQSKINIDLNLKPFPVNKLAETINNIGINMFNGAIISNASEKDLSDLKDMTNLFAPILLFTRKQIFLAVLRAIIMNRPLRWLRCLQRGGTKMWRLFVQGILHPPII